MNISKLNHILLPNQAERSTPSYDSKKDNGPQINTPSTSSEPIAVFRSENKVRQSNEQPTSSEQSTAIRPENEAHQSNILSNSSESDAAIRSENDLNQINTPSISSKTIKDILENDNLKEFPWGKIDENGWKSEWYIIVHPRPIKNLKLTNIESELLKRLNEDLNILFENQGTEINIFVETPKGNVCKTNGLVRLILYGRPFLTTKIIELLNEKFNNSSINSNDLISYKESITNDVKLLNESFKNDLKPKWSENQRKLNNLDTFENEFFNKVIKQSPRNRNKTQYLGMEPQFDSRSRSSSRSNSEYTPGDRNSNSNDKTQKKPKSPKKLTSPEIGRSPKSNSRSSSPNIKENLEKIINEYRNSETNAIEEGENTFTESLEIYEVELDQLAVSLLKIPHQKKDPKHAANYQSIDNEDYIDIPEIESKKISDVEEYTPPISNSEIEKELTNYEEDLEDNRINVEDNHLNFRKKIKEKSIEILYKRFDKIFKNILIKANDDNQFKLKLLQEFHQNEKLRQFQRYLFNRLNITYENDIRIDSAPSNDSETNDGNLINTNGNKFEVVGDPSKLSITDDNFFDDIFIASKEDTINEATKLISQYFIEFNKKTIDEFHEFLKSNFYNVKKEDLNAAVNIINSDDKINNPFFSQIKVLLKNNLSDELIKSIVKSLFNDEPEEKIVDCINYFKKNMNQLSSSSSSNQSNIENKIPSSNNESPTSENESVAMDIPDDIESITSSTHNEVEDSNFESDNEKQKLDNDLTENNSQNQSPLSESEPVAMDIPDNIESVASSSTNKEIKDGNIESDSIDIAVDSHNIGTISDTNNQKDTTFDSEETESEDETELYIRMKEPNKKTSTPPSTSSTNEKTNNNIPISHENNKSKKRKYNTQKHKDKHLQQQQILLDQYAKAKREQTEQSSQSEAPNYELNWNQKMSTDVEAYLNQNADYLYYFKDNAFKKLKDNVKSEWSVEYKSKKYPWIAYKNRTGNIFFIDPFNTKNIQQNNYDNVSISEKDFDSFFEEDLTFNKKMSSSKETIHSIAQKRLCRYFNVPGQNKKKFIEDLKKSKRIENPITRSDTITNKIKESSSSSKIGPSNLIYMDLIFKSTVTENESIFLEKHESKLLKQGLLYIANSTFTRAGQGIFALEEISAGTFLGIYRGRRVEDESSGDYVISGGSYTIDGKDIPRDQNGYDATKCEENRMGKFNFSDENNERVNTLSIINHSKEQANVKKTPILLKNGETAIGFFTKYNIKLGTELTIDYGGDFQWEEPTERKRTKTEHYTPSFGPASKEPGGFNSPPQWR